MLKNMKKGGKDKKEGKKETKTKKEVLPVSLRSKKRRKRFLRMKRKK